MQPDRRIIRGENWRVCTMHCAREIVEMGGLLEGIRKLNPDSAVLALACAMEEKFSRLVEQAQQISCYEPGLRYWQLAKGTVWASTLDEATLRNIKEISYEDFQELRKAEWAQLTEPSQHEA